MLTELQTGDPGGHEDYLYFIRDYRVEYNHDGPAFVKVRQTVAYRFTEEPAVYLKTPGGFRSKADTLMVRASAAMINEPFIPDLGTFGNIIAKYRSRCRGDILAVKSYGKGNDWYYVEIYPDAVPSASILYNTDRMPTFLRGWVSGLAIVIAEK
jgi:hypothetical protein